MRFLADMGISPKSVFRLRNLGHDAQHLYERGQERLHDPAILRNARKEGRILLTHDLDFGELMAASKAKLPSVVIFRLRNMRPECVNHYLDEIIAHHHDTLIKGVLVIVSEGHIRTRSLPIKASE